MISSTPGNYGVEREHLGGLGRDVKMFSSTLLLSVVNLGFGWAACAVSSPCQPWCDGFFSILELQSGWFLADSNTDVQFAGGIISRLAVICKHSWAAGWMVDLVSPDGTLTE